MKAEGKAKELVLNMACVVAETSEVGGGYSDIKLGKAPALMCVDEIIESLTEKPHESNYIYWQEVEHYIKQM